jgi:hypothetical protein
MIPTNGKKTKYLSKVAEHPSGAQTKRQETKCPETKHPGTKHPEGQNIQRQNIRRDKTSGRTKHPDGQSVQQTKRLWGQNVWRHKVCETKHLWQQNVQRDKISEDIMSVWVIFLMSIIDNTFNFNPTDKSIEHGGKIHQTYTSTPAGISVCLDCLIIISSVSI